MREGNSLIDAGDCTAARSRFQRAKAAYPTSYKVEVNIGTALECLGKVADAATRFEIFLEHADAADRDMIQGVLARVTALRKRVGRIVVTCPAGASARVVVDGAESPLRGLAYAAPGRHGIAAVCGEERHTRQVQLAAGEQHQIKISAGQPKPDLAIVPTSAPVDEPRPSSPEPATPVYKRWWFWTIIGAVVVGAAVGGAVAATTGGSDRMPQGEAGHISME